MYKNATDSDFVLESVLFLKAKAYLNAVKTQFKNALQIGTCKGTLSRAITVVHFHVWGQCYTIFTIVIFKLT